jgi:O-antigen ligase
MNGPSAGVHNIYLQTWLNYGFFGLLAYLGIWVVFFLKSLRASRRASRFGYENAVLWGVMAGAAGLMVAGVFENNFRDGEVQTCLLMLMGLSLRQMYKSKKRIFRMT